MQKDKIPANAGASSGQAAAEPAPSSSVQMVCKVLVNGALIAECHHAAGKQLPLPRDKAEALAGLNPPLVEIIGVQ